MSAVLSLGVQLVCITIQKYVCGVCPSVCSVLLFRMSFSSFCPSSVCLSVCMFAVSMLFSFSVWPFKIYMCLPVCLLLSFMFFRFFFCMRLSVRLSVPTFFLFLILFFCLYACCAVLRFSACLYDYSKICMWCLSVCLFCPLIPYVL